MGDMLRLPDAGAYRVILADPAWEFETRSEAGLVKSPAAHYRVSPLEEMGQLPVRHMCWPDAWLMMWVTWPHLPQAFELARMWSDPANPWTYCTGGAWAKRPRGWQGDPDKWGFGTGYIFRSASEPLLVFKRGNPLWLTKSERNLWVAPIRKHSQKPEQVRDMIRRSTLGPRLEMFANDDAPGFDRWGDGH